MLIQGQVQDKDNVQVKWVGYRVSAAFSQLVDPGTGTPLPTPSELQVDVGEDGKFSITLPDRKDLEAAMPVTFKVLAPAGEFLATSEVTPANLAANPVLPAFVVEPKAAFEVKPSQDPFLGGRPKLTGRVLDYEGNRLLANRQVILLGVPQGTLVGNVQPSDKDFTVVAVTRTDAQGYFSTDYPRAVDLLGNLGEPLQFDVARAVVAGAKDVGGGPAITIRLVSMGDFDGVFPRSLVIVVRLDNAIGADTEDDCQCHAEVPRSPDSADLTNSPGAYSTDLVGGKCVNLTAPNRALEEFSFYTVVRTTDPEIAGFDAGRVTVLPPTVVRTIAATEGTVVIGPPPPAGGTVRGRGSAVAIHPAVLARELASPGVTPAAALAKSAAATAMLRNLDLVKRFQLVPAGRTAVSKSSPILWDDPVTPVLEHYQATSIAHGHILHFKQVWRADGYSLGDLLYSLPLAPAQKKQIAVVDWERQETAARTERLDENESLSNLLTRDRDISEIVNATVQEHVHGDSNSVTMGAGQGSGAAGNGSYGGFNMGAVTASAFGGGFSQAAANQDATRSLAASAIQKIRDTTMQAASAVRSQRSTVIQTVSQGETVTVTTEVVANHNHCHAMTIEYFEVLRHFQVSQELADVQECLLIPLTLALFDNPRIQRWRDILFTFLRKPALAPGFDAIDRIENEKLGYDTGLPAGTYADDLVRFLEGSLIIELRLPTGGSPGFFEQAWDAFSNWLGGSNPTNPRTDTQLLFEIDKGGATQALPIEFTLVTEFADRTPLYVRMRPYKDLPSFKRSEVTSVRIYWKKSPDFPEGTQLLVRSGSMRYRTDHIHHSLFSESNINAGLAMPEAWIDTPLDREELRNPHNEDDLAARRLTTHLNQHIEYYHKAIWWNMDQDRRYMLLDGFTAPNANGRSVASVVENRLIGFVGNSIVLPVAPGLRLDPTYQGAQGNQIDLINAYAPTTPIPPMRVSVPTRGVFAEAVMGQCNSCEQKEETRFWRWDEAPTGDEPTPIASPSAASRATPEPNLTAKDFPTPMINIQNAPAEPDPTGLANALKLLGTPNLFKDMTGLDQTQKNSLAAMQAALDAAKYFGGEASKLAQQAGMKQGGIDKSLQSIQQAQKAGLIDDKQASDLAGSALRSLVGGSSEKKQNLTEDPAVKGALNSATAKPESKVSVKRGDETVDVETSSGTNVTPVNWVRPEPVGVITATASYPHYEELQKILAAQPLDIDAAVGVIERSLLGWGEFRVDLGYSDGAHPGPGIQGLDGSAIYVSGNVLLYVAKASTDTDGRTNNIGANPTMDTSYRVRDGGGNLVSLDAFADNYFVVSKCLLSSAQHPNGLCAGCRRSKQFTAPRAGALGLIKSYRRNTRTFGVYGDAGPCHSTGEISVALAQSLGYVINNPAVDSAEDQPTPGVLYVIFLGTEKTRASDKVTAAELATEADTVLPDALKEYAWHLLNRAIREAPDVSPSPQEGDLFEA